MSLSKCLPPEIAPVLSVLSSTEKTDHAKSRAYLCKKYEEEEK
jgi:hypothetical protein